MDAFSMPMVYGGFVDKWPLGAFMEKGLTPKTGQTHVQHYLLGLLKAIVEGKIDTTFLISHHLPLENAPDGYKLFHDHQARDVEPGRRDPREASRPPDDPDPLQSRYIEAAINGVLVPGAFPRCSF